MVGGGGQTGVPSLGAPSHPGEGGDSGLGTP